MGLNIFEIFAKIGLDTSEYDKDIDKSREKASGLASSLKKGFGIAAKSVGVLTTATGALGAGFVKASGNVAAYGDNIDKMSQKMGMSAEAYQEWDAVMQHSGTSMETLKASMKTLANAAQTGSDAFDKLGISQEEIANMSQEELFSATITALQNIDDETERTYLAGKTLGRGATELGALLNTSAEDTQAMKDRVHELGGVMSDEAVKAAAAYQDSLQDMQTALTGLKNNLVSEMLPAVTTVMDGLGNVFSGDYETGVNQIEEGIEKLINKITKIIPKVMKIGGSILESLGQSILQNLPELSQAALEIILQLAQGIVEQLPTIAETAAKILQVLITGIGQALPTLIPAAVQAIITIVQTLIAPENISMLIDGAIQLITGLAEGIIEALPILIDAIPEIIQALLTAILENLPKLVNMGIELTVQLGMGLIAAIPDLVAMIPEIIAAIALALIDGVPEMVKSGGDLIDGLISAFVDNPILDSFEEWWTELKDWWGGVIDDIFDWGVDLMQSFEDGIESMLGSDWVEFWEDIGGDIYDYLHFSQPDKGPLSGPNGFKTFGPDMIKTFVEGVKSNEPLLQDELSSVMQGVQTAFNTPITPDIGGTVPLGYGSLQTSANSEQPIVIQVDGETFAKFVYKYNNREAQRVGATLTEAVSV